MKLEIKQHKPDKDSFVRLPVFLFHLRKNRKSFSYSKYFFMIGRLYQGYIGIMLTTPWIYFDLWIMNSGPKIKSFSWIRF